MPRVFIGGSRRLTRLNADVQRRIDKIIEQGFPILVGDANGADKAVQTYLTLSFVVAIDDQIGAPAAWQVNDPAALTAWRQYVTAVVRQRLHRLGLSPARAPRLPAVLRHLPAPS